VKTLFSKKQNFPLWLLLAWGLVNLVQAANTELFHDEAYYWMFSRHLAWGYAEHAPMVALVIRIGTALMGGEIGVRLMAVFLNLGTVILIYKLTDRKEPLLLALLAFSMVEMHVAGFLAVPDAPMIFFVALFLYRYRLWLEKESWGNTLWLTLAVLGIVYSKYHGLMVLFFTILSRPSLLRNSRFWFMAVVATLLFLPHLSFLWETEFATFRYHLLDRIREPKPLQFSMQYLLDQLLVAGPLMGFVLFPAAFRYKTKTDFEKSLQWILLGVLAFLLLLSFRTRIEANWSASAFIPLLLLAYAHIREQENWRKWVNRLALPSLVILFTLRVYLMVDFFPPLRELRKEFHYWPEWAAQIAQKAGDRTVVFQNSYQRPSKYMFYAGKPAYVLNNYGYHKTQYDLWTYMEDSIQGKEVMLIGGREFPGADSMETKADSRLYFRNIPRFCSYNQVEIEWLSPERTFVQGKEQLVRLRFHTGKEAQIRYPADREFEPLLAFRLFRYDQLVDSQEIPELFVGQGLEDAWELEVPIKFNAEPGQYHGLFSISTGWLEGGINGRFEPIEVLPAD
jgi:4-amino-4-deoxy-L-arabinose transferase-like glycosyltransferase